MNYNEMADHDINKLVAESLGKTVVPNTFFETNDKYMLKKWTDDKEHVDGGFYYSSHMPNYCNNPADAWSIIVDNRISLFPTSYTKQGWQAEHAIHGVVKHKNPLRAAMIVFLMMKGAE